MPLYEFWAQGCPPDRPVRKKEDVRKICARWDEIADSDADSWVDYEQLDEDIHALAHIAMQYLPD